MDFDMIIRGVVAGYSRVPAMDRDRTEVRMSAATGEVIWQHMQLMPRSWTNSENDLKWDESKLDDATLFGLRVRRDDSVPPGEVQWWTRR